MEAGSWILGGWRGRRGGVGFSTTAESNRTGGPFIQAKLASWEVWNCRFVGLRTEALSIDHTPPNVMRHCGGYLLMFLTNSKQ